MSDLAKKLMRERVARAMFYSNEWNEPGDFEKQHHSERDNLFRLADAAIASHLEALIEMELPAEIYIPAAAQEFEADYHSTPKFETFFKAVLRKLQGGAQ